MSYGVIIVDTVFSDNVISVKIGDFEIEYTSFQEDMKKAERYSNGGKHPK